MWKQLLVINILDSYYMFFIHNHTDRHQCAWNQLSTAHR